MTIMNPIKGKILLRIITWLIVPVLLINTTVLYAEDKSALAPNRVNFNELLSTIERDDFYRGLGVLDPKTYFSSRIDISSLLEDLNRRIRMKGVSGIRLVESKDGKVLYIGGKYFIDVVSHERDLSSDLLVNTLSNERKARRIFRHNDIKKAEENIRRRHAVKNEKLNAALLKMRKSINSVLLAVCCSLSVSLALFFSDGNEMQIITVLMSALILFFTQALLFWKISSIRLKNVLNDLNPTKNRLGKLRTLKGILHALYVNYVLNFALILASPYAILKVLKNLDVSMLEYRFSVLSFVIPSELFLYATFCVAVFIYLFTVGEVINYNLAIIWKKEITVKSVLNALVNWRDTLKSIDGGVTGKDIKRKKERIKELENSFYIEISGVDLDTFFRLQDMLYSESADRSLIEDSVRPNLELITAV